tara:strand:+ start:981 stop:1259 length:279 start_codon:yes stop_codon:yes gene_type:complete
MYKRERKLQTHHRCDCGGVIVNHITEKAKVGGGWPMAVKSVGICGCGEIHWKKDLTNYAKEEYRQYLVESNRSRKNALKNGESWRVVISGSE